jgi:hypothetical protein
VLDQIPVSKKLTEKTWKHMRKISKELENLSMDKAFYNGTSDSRANVAFWLENKLLKKYKDEKTTQLYQLSDIETIWRFQLNDNEYVDLRMLPDKLQLIPMGVIEWV